MSSVRPESAHALDAFREKKQGVTVSLQELADFADKIGAKSLRERIARDLVHKLEEDRFHLVVVGEFNHGKSTFVNALLGKQVLPVGVTPTTATIHHLKYSEQPEATVVYASGKREPVKFEDVKRFVVGGDKGSDSIDFVEVGYPAPLLEERILLVDTPGVNDLSLQRADITYSYIPRADAVLFLLDAGQILKESERVFLNDKLLKASRDKIIFIVTKWDILSPEERKEAYAYAKDQLGKLVQDPVLFAISAETALSGKRAESGLVELVAHLTKFLAEERGRIMLDNALGEGLAVASLLQKGLDARSRAVAMKGEELERRIQALTTDLEGQATTIEERRSKIREEVQGIKVGANKDLDRFIDEL
ncbi:MAG: dynamin family protein, partial [Polyangiaceae bacterium]